MAGRVQGAWNAKRVGASSARRGVRGSARGSARERRACVAVRKHTTAGTRRARIAHACLRPEGDTSASLTARIRSLLALSCRAWRASASAAAVASAGASVVARLSLIARRSARLGQHARGARGVDEAAGAVGVHQVAGEARRQLQQRDKCSAE